MTIAKYVRASLTALAAAAFVAAAPTMVSAQDINIGPDDIGGVVTGPNGPEAGVWVVAETFELGVKRFAKIVVTGDDGRYVIPDLPGRIEHTPYQVWVRGYGLTDSDPVNTEPGQRLDLTAVVAPDEREAAYYYPGSYWWAMLDIPAASNFPGTGAQGNGFPDNLETHQHWIQALKQNGCGNCHQAGGARMRTISDFHLDQADGDHEIAWSLRLSSGNGGPNMINAVSNLQSTDGGLLKRLADWTTRIAAGDTPSQTPERPSGVERNLVVSIWDWGRPTMYMHDLITTDKRNPTVNGYGYMTGAMEVSTDWTPFLDPKNNITWEQRMPMLSYASPRSTTANAVNAASQTFGLRQIWKTHVNAHTNMMDQDRRTYWTASVRPQWEQPEFCYAEDSDHPSAQVFPLLRASGNPENTTNFVQNARGITIWDPNTEEWSHVDTCFGTHHLNFGYDADNTLFIGGNSNNVLGWVNTRVFFETGSSRRAQGWAPFVLDTNGNGVRDAWVEPDAELDPTKDMRVQRGMYGITPDPTDPNVIWGSDAGFATSAFMRVALGDNPSETAVTELYKVPFPKEFGIRGFDVDSTGKAWGAGGGGYLYSFDRSKCAVLNGPTATGDHCPEGFTFIELPGPKFEGGNVEGPLATVASPYYVWVDVHDILGLGTDTVVVLDNQSDGVQAYLQTGEWVHIAIPYPMAFFAKGWDGRIDDPNGGWKGRGWWGTWSGRAPQHIEGIGPQRNGGGPGTTPFVVQIQLRPDTLAN